MNNNLVVLKFGGTSMGSAETINECVNVIKEKLDNKQNPFVVVSAVSKMTDKLLSMLELAKNNKQKELKQSFNEFKEKHFTILNNITKDKDLLTKYKTILDKKNEELEKILDGISLMKDYSDKTHALVASYGEDLSSDLIECCLCERKINAKKIHSKNFVKTNGNYLSADVDFPKSKNCFKKILDNILNDKLVYVMTGFFGSNTNNEIMLLGRGGSDFSASIAGICLSAKTVEIWTDADGVMSADPRIIKDAKIWDCMNKNIAAEMARAGAKVLHPKTISASYYNIDIVIKNLFNRNFKGTLIDDKNYGDDVIGVVSDSDYSIIHFENQDMFGNPGFIEKIGSIANKNNISFDMVTTSETSVSSTAKTNSLSDNVLKLFEKIANVTVINDTIKISIIGNNINKSEILSKIFNSLKKENINPLMVSVGSSNKNIGIIVNKDDKEKTLLSLHKELIK